MDTIIDTKESTVNTQTDDGEMAVVITEPVKSPKGGEWPTVLWFIDLPGIRPATREAMARLASSGYRVVTPDLHHRIGRLMFKEPSDLQDSEARQQMLGWREAMTDDQIQHDGECALAAAGVHENTRFATIGFCLGARAVYRVIQNAAGRVVAGSCFHPSYLADDAPDSPHLSVTEYSTPMFLGIGEADQVQTMAMHQRFLDAVAPLSHVEVATFPGVDHGFTWPGYPNYDENAAETSWSRTIELFARAFQHGT